MRIIPILLSILLAVPSWGQELPPVSNYGPNQYQGGNQNWMISQAADKNIYVANSRGLLEYNGAHWNLYPMPNNTIVRCVKVVEDKIFTGAYMEVGYWQKDEMGELRYTSLLPKFSGSIQDGEQFWHIEQIGENVIIQSFEGIYLYNLSTQEVTELSVPGEEPILNLFNSNGSIYFQLAGKGLFKIQRGRAVLEIPIAVLGTIDLVYLRAEPDQKLFLVGREGNFFEWDGGKLVRRYQELTQTIKGISLFSLLDLENDDFLLGTVENGIYQINSTGKIVHHFNQQNALLNNTVLSLFVDRESNIWAGLDYGMSVLNLHSSFELFQDNVGRIGTVYTSFQVDDFLYIGTNQGLYFRKSATEDFQLVEGTNGQVWSLQMVDDKLFCGHNNGTFIVKEEKATKISDRLGTWIVRSFNQGDEKMLIQGHYNGFSFLKKEDGGYSEWPLVKEFPHSSKYIIVGANSQIWIANEHKGVFRLKVDDSLRTIEEVRNYTFPGTSGITSSLFRFNDTLYYSTKDAIFRYQREKDNFEKSSSLSTLIGKKNRISGRIVEQGEKIWAFGANELISVEPAQLRRAYILDEISLPRDLKSIPVGYENISKLRSGKFLLGLVDGYLLFQEDRVKENKSFTLRLNKLTRAAIDEPPVAVPLQGKPEFEFVNNNVVFHFSIPEYKKFQAPMYSYRLLGLSPRWSSWSSNPAAAFENLPFGEYTFQVRGRIGNSIASPEEFSFLILRPWYLSGTAIAGYFLLFILFLILLHHVYQREHRKRMRENEKELKMRNLEAEKKIIKLQNEQLAKEMEGKSKELAVSTMSLIKKNEFLTNIRRKLQQAENSSQVESVIKTIDKDISEEDNWNFFKKAFNNADKDFLQKIKRRHPELTSNDLKLCAYLRLNLSSKEIAPLLNISVKSVEIKRHRLRKKMCLPSKSNLVEYILEI